MKFRIIFMYLVSIIILIFSIIQWQFLYPDFSQLIFGCGLALFVACIGYLWEWMELTNKYIENLSYRIDSLALVFKEYEDLKGGNI